MEPLSRSIGFQLGLDIYVGLARQMRGVAHHRETVHAVAVRAKLRGILRGRGHDSRDGMRRVPGRDVHDLPIGQLPRNDRHQFMLARAITESRQLGGEVAHRLTRYVRGGHDPGVTVKPMAGSALSGRYIASGGWIAHGRLLGQDRPSEENPAERQCRNSCHSP